MPTALSGTGASHDQQVEAAMRFLAAERPLSYSQVIGEFPEPLVWQEGHAWLDTEAMGVDPEWSSWLTDAIERTGYVTWDDGEPYGETG